MVLQKLYDAAIKTADNYVICCDISLRSDQRKEVCTWLQNNGFIENYKSIGKTKVQCQVTQKTMEYFIK